MRERTAPAKPPDLSGHSAPAVGFEVPLEMRAACHGRVEAQCTTLRHLVAHLGVHGAARQIGLAMRARRDAFEPAQPPCPPPRLTLCVGPLH